MKKLNQVGIDGAIFFTIVAKNYFAYAKVLCRSVALHHPEAIIFIAISDLCDEEFIANESEFELIQLSDLELPEADKLAFRYDVMEFSTAIKPFVFAWIFGKFKANKVIYLDPDIYVLSPLAKVIELLDLGHTAVLTPHLLDRIDDNCTPGERQIMQAGIYNLGFIGISRSDEGFKLIKWWSDRLERGAVVDLENGLFTDQKWADLMPAIFDKVSILRSPAYNVAYWNLMQRKIEFRDGRYYANNEVICFIHFSGINPNNIKQFSKHQNRFTVSDIGALEAPYRHYITLILDAGYNTYANKRYAYSYFSNGTDIHKGMRAYFRALLDADESVSKHPFKDLGYAYFDSLEKSLVGNLVISKMMYGMYLSEKKLQKIYDLNLLDDQIKYAIFFALNANRFGVNDLFIHSAAYRLSRNRIKYSYVMHFPMKVFEKLAPYIYRINPGLSKKLFHMLPGALQLRLKSRFILSNVIQRNFNFLAWCKAKLELNFQPKLQLDGVNLIGYAKGDFGVAQNMRMMAGALAHYGNEIDVYDISTNGQYNETDHSMATNIVNHSNRKLQIFCVNADQTKNVMAKIGHKKLKNRYKIGVWFWELSQFPEAWVPNFESFDEIWAPTKFIQEALLKATKKPVIRIPVAVDFSLSQIFKRSDYSLPDSKFLFLFSYDFYSFSKRKNPEAAIAAFLHAFSDVNENVGLVIKTVYAEKHSEAYKKLLNITSNDHRITIINEVYSRDKMYGLINVCDVYVSLHRSEGFGLGLAESMLLGKPVIATGYSGNMDFMTSENSCIVDHKLVSVGENNYPFWENQVWAEPDVLHASQHMKRLYEDDSYRLKISKNALIYMKKEHSFEKVGARINERLNTLGFLSMSNHD